jgi:hypothetical protein
MAETHGSAVPPRQVRPRVAVALDERVPGLAVGRDGGGRHAAVLVARRGRFREAAGTAGHRGCVRRGGVGHRDRDVDDAVAVRGDVLRQRGAAGDRPLEHEARGAGLEDVGRTVTVAGLRTAVGGHREAECGRVEERRLPGVAHREVDGVDAEDGKGVDGRGGLLKDDGHGPKSAIWTTSASMRARISRHLCG